MLLIQTVQFLTWHDTHLPLLLLSFKCMGTSIAILILDHRKKVYIIYRPCRRVLCEDDHHSNKVPRQEPLHNIANIPHFCTVLHESACDTRLDFPCAPPCLVSREGAAIMERPGRDEVRAIRADLSTFGSDQVQFR